MHGHVVDSAPTDVYSDGRLTDKTTIVAFLAPFCCTTEFIVGMFCSVFNVLTMHLKMKPKGNY